MGRQIAIWGEALTDVVTDVVQPTDLRNGFFVGNQEDARIPQWMARATYQVPALKSSVEMIVSPNWVENNYRVGWVGQEDMAPPYTGQRFAQYPEDRPSVMPWIPQLTDIKYPASDSVRYGFRTSTVSESTQFGFLYWHGQNYQPVSVWGTRGFIPIPTPFGVVPGPATRQFALEFPSYDLVGFYGNKQLGSTPGVIRTEVAYSPNKPYDSLKGLETANSTSSGLVRRDWAKYLIAYDLNGFLYFPWHNTASFDVTFEHVGEWIPSAQHDMIEFSNYNTVMPVYHAAFNMRVSTNWFYDKLETSVIVGYDTFGASGLFLPDVKWIPGWFNKNLTFDLRYYHWYARDHYEGAGILMSKDLAMLETQFNF